MSRKLSAPKNHLRYNKSKTQHWISSLFLTACWLKEFYQNIQRWFSAFPLEKFENVNTKSWNLLRITGFQSEACQGCHYRFNLRFQFIPWTVLPWHKCISIFLGVWIHSNGAVYHWLHHTFFDEKCTLNDHNHNHDNNHSRLDISLHIYSSSPIWYIHGFLF